MDMTTYKYRPFGQTVLEKIIVALIAVNLIGPFIDPQHPTGRLWDGVIFLIEKWVEMIGWVMGWFTSFLPRATSLRGTGQFLLSTVITIVFLVIALLILAWFYKRMLRPFLKNAGLFNTARKVGSHMLFQIFILLGLMALFFPTLLRLFSNTI